MGIELKTFSPVVFDDLFNCQDDDDQCIYLYPGAAYCVLFNKDTGYQYPHAKKCTECLDHYQRNKQ